MQRYFIRSIDLKNQKAFLSGNDFHHISKVMRKRINDEIVVCDYSGSCYFSIIKSFNKDTVEAELVEEQVNPSRGFKVTIAQSLIRRERFEYMLQKSTELGADKVIPILTKNTIIKVDNKKIKSKIERWNTITKEASEQSHRNTINVVEDVINLKELNIDEFDCVLVAYEKENKNNELKKALKSTFKNILVIIGPEGGFHPSEIEYLSTFENARFVGLGPRILRSETASSYILGVLSYVYEMSD